MPREKVSVVVPTYNRASLLERTIPTYLQDDVAELILVDDCSTDGTREAAAKLSERDPRVRYIRSERNLKQTHAKNLGISAAACDLVYFGDDDSILIPGSISRLIDTMRETEADIVGASCPYMNSEVDLEDLEGFLGRRSDIRRIVEPIRLKTHFDSAPPGPVVVPFVHAAFLCRTGMARDLKFDEGYIGNCFREETDFLVRARAGGAKIIYEPRAVQANLPRSAAPGGAHGRGSFFIRKIKYLSHSALNNRRFIRKNRKALAAALGVDVSPAFRNALFMIDIGKVLVNYMIRKTSGRAD